MCLGNTCPKRYGGKPEPCYYYKNKYYHIDDEKYLDKLRQRIKIYSETEYQRYEEIVVDIQNMARNKEKNNI